MPRGKQRGPQRVLGIDHLVLSVSDFDRSRDFYRKVLGFLGFDLRYDYSEAAGFHNGKTRLWIMQADEDGRGHKHRKGEVGFHHYAFELASRSDVDALGAFLDKHGMTVTDPPGTYNGDDDYYAVFFEDPDGMRLEGMKWGPEKKPARTKAAKSTKKSAKKKKKASKKRR
jgi:catechol 2,3-dioxygenase-like lactoylglutathione lyase family enzyme